MIYSMLSVLHISMLIYENRMIYSISIGIVYRDIIPVLYLYSEYNIMNA